jgi:thiol-disulfide isomerase/thioredoxin
MLNKQVIGMIQCHQVKDFIKQKARSAYAFIAVCDSARSAECFTTVRRVAVPWFNCQHRYAAHEWGVMPCNRALSHTAINTKALRAFCRNILTTLLLALSIPSIASARNRVIENPVDEFTVEMPAGVPQWIETELSKAKRKTLMNFDAGEFFASDTARLIGYLKGYDPRAGFTTGIVYTENLITREDHPTVVQVHEDGRFEGSIPLSYPACLNVKFGDRFIEFYIQPGQTLAMLLDWEDFPNTRFEGAAAELNRELAAFNAALPKIPYGKVYNERDKKTPGEFKTFYDNEVMADYTAAYHRQMETQKLSGQAKAILQNSYKVKYAMYLFEYEINYARNHEDNPLPLDFYDFLQDIPMDDKTLLSANDFSLFINRLEYCAPFNAAYEAYKYFDEGVEKVTDEHWRIKDSIYINELKLKQGIAYDIIKVRSLGSLFEYLEDQKETASNIRAAIKAAVGEPFLWEESDRLFQKHFPAEQQTAYKLPDTYEAGIFKEIIAPFKGKILLVDFWATSCGPCVYNIKQHKELREQYKDSPDVAFIFITSENESPLGAYNKFVEEQELTHTFRLNADRYRYLRQLFRFNGIPRYVLVDREGDIPDDNLSEHLHEQRIKEAIEQVRYEK